MRLEPPNVCPTDISYRFVDRDMFMRHAGGGIGHAGYGAVQPEEDNLVEPLDDLEEENRCDGLSADDCDSDNVDSDREDSIVDDEDDASIDSDDDVGPDDGEDLYEDDGYGAVGGNAEVQILYEHEIIASWFI